MTDGLDYLGRARMQGILLLVVAFLVGAIAGMAGDRLLSRAGGPPPRPEPLGPRADGRGPGPRDHRLPPALERLDLSEAQHAAIESLIVASQPGNRALLESVMPRLRAHADSLQDRIREQLDDAQRKAFDADVKARRDAGLQPPMLGGPRGPGLGRPGEFGPPGGPGMPPPPGGRGFGRPPGAPDGPPPGEGESRR